MKNNEFSNQFDVLYNNITSDKAPGLNEYEKSVFLTKAQDEIVKNHFNPKSNSKTEGFDDTSKRQADFSMLMKTYNTNTKYEGNTSLFDPRSIEFKLPEDLFIIVNESLGLEKEVVKNCIAYYGSSTVSAPLTVMKYDPKLIDVFNKDYVPTYIDEDTKRDISYYYNMNAIPMKSEVIYECPYAFYGATDSTATVNTGNIFTLNPKYSTIIKNGVEKEVYDFFVPTNEKELKEIAEQVQLIYDLKEKESAAEETAEAGDYLENGLYKYKIFDINHNPLNNLILTPDNPKAYIEVYSNGHGFIDGVIGDCFYYTKITPPYGYNTTVDMGQVAGGNGTILFVSNKDANVSIEKNGNDVSTSFVIECDPTKSSNGTDSLGFKWRSYNDNSTEFENLQTLEVPVVWKDFNEDSNDPSFSVTVGIQSTIDKNNTSNSLPLSIDLLGVCNLVGIKCNIVAGENDNEDILLENPFDFIQIKPDDTNISSYYTENSSKLLFKDQNNDFYEFPSPNTFIGFTLSWNTEAIESYNKPFKYLQLGVIIRSKSNLTTPITNLPVYLCRSNITFANFKWQEETEVDTGTTITPTIPVSNEFNPIDSTDTPSTGTEEQHSFEVPVCILPVNKSDYNINFDTTAVGDYSTATIKVKVTSLFKERKILDNDPYGTLTVGFNNRNSAFSASPSSVVIDNEDEKGQVICTFDIKFKPSVAGLHQDTIIFSLSNSNMKGIIMNTTLKCNLEGVAKNVENTSEPTEDPSIDPNENTNPSEELSGSRLVKVDLGVIRFDGVPHSWVMVINRFKDRNWYYNGVRQIIPITYDEYRRLMSKPYKEPLKWQAWRLITNTDSTDNVGIIEVIPNNKDRRTTLVTRMSYDLRYVKRPRPIILEDFSDAYGENVSIQNKKGNEQEYSNGGTKNEWEPCELDPILHEEILQRAVELAKVAWAGDANSNIQTGVRSE